jgi:hypothetical protein
MTCLFVFRPLFYVIQNVIDRLLGIVSCNSTLDICEEFGIMFDGLEKLAASAT